MASIRQYNKPARYEKPIKVPEARQTAITAKMPAQDSSEPWPRNRLLRFLFHVLCFAAMPILGLYMWIRHPKLCIREVKRLWKKN